MSSNQRVLIISPVPTHPVTAGNRARIHMLLETLEILDVDFHFIFITWEKGDKDAMQKRWGAHRVTVVSHQPRPRYAAFWRRVRNFTLRHLDLERFHPLEVDCYRSPELAQAVMHVADDFQPTCVMVEYVFISWMLDLFPATVRKLIDTLDKFAHRYKQYLKAGVQTGWFSTTRRQERKGLRRADCIVAIQAEEADYFRRLTNGRVITVGHIAPIVPTGESTTDIPTVLFLGPNSPANRDAVSYCIKEIWPIIRSQLPEARLLIAGGVCQSVLDTGDGIEVCGHVSDAASLYAKAHVVLNPVRVGTGLKIKSIEALSYGRPLVTTSAGAWGIEGNHDSACLVGEDARGLAEHCLLLLRDHQKRRSLSMEAIRFMNDYNQRNYEALKMALGIADDRPLSPSENSAPRAL